MQNDIQRQILGAFLVALRPIARILLRFGIGFREFSEISKTAFVDVASREYGLRGRPTNISRVAVMTGLTRKEVRRIREKIEGGDQAVVVKATPLSEILHRWHAESDFLNESGRPAVLPFAGDERSFSDLVRRFGGDIPPGAMRTELKRVGAIEENERGELQVIKRTVHPKGAHEKLITALVHALYPLASTISHNVDPERNGDPWTQIDTFSQSIRKRDLTRLRRISFDRLSEVAESFDDLFMAYEALHDKDVENEETSTVAVGVFYFEETDKSAGVEW
ncbi:MAG: DUF6502 family protein [Woeseiaceae bacterium]|nr:DUF6502 family protein [Woeseiaceae bacterium]